MRASWENENKALHWIFLENKPNFDNEISTRTNGLADCCDRYSTLMHHPFVQFGAFPNDTVSRLWVKIMIYSFTDRILLGHE